MQTVRAISTRALKTQLLVRPSHWNVTCTMSFVIPRREHMVASVSPIENGLKATLGSHDERTRELESVLAHHLPLFHRYAVRYLGNAADAQDTVKARLTRARSRLQRRVRSLTLAPRPGHCLPPPAGDSSTRAEFGDRKIKFKKGKSRVLARSLWQKAPQ